MGIMAFINGLALVTAVICWVIGAISAYLQYKEATFDYRELRDYARGYTVVYTWKPYIVMAIIATVWIVTMW